ncbi:MAG: helix-turn-helix domain containing protein [Eubacteriales bacterium]|nr:helix-turn-helix domain containing protein [Eubacteriales bacterium]
MKKTGVDDIERGIYSAICSRDGIKAKEIGKLVRADRSTVNHYLYNSPFMHELCYRDDDFYWHGLIRQMRPHIGLGDFCGYYGSVKEFLGIDEEEWLNRLTEGCRNIGRNLNDTRGLFHSFRDARETMRNLFTDMDGVFFEDWEIAFELRINRARYIRIYADVLVITEDKVFSLEFKMKDVIDPDEVSQAAKYVAYLEVIFGPEYDVIPALVLTKAADLYTYKELYHSTAEIPVCSGDMLFNLFDEYLGFLED